MKVDHTAWCEPENKAGQYLANTLEKVDNEKLREKVGVYLHRFHKRVKALNNLDRETRVFYLQLLLQKTRVDIRENFWQSKVVATLVENLIVGAYRKELMKL